jgi:hypothetical protein
MAHMIAALFIIVTLVLPLIGLSFAKLDKGSLISRVNLLLKALRLQNIMLLVSVVSGFLIMGGFYLDWWVLTVLGLAIIYGGVLSIIIKTLKNLKIKAEGNLPYQTNIKSYLNWSLIASLIVIGLLVFKIVY